MAWSAAVRRDAQGPPPSPSPLPRLQLDSLNALEDGNTSLSIAVIDANALISFDSSARLLALTFSSSSSSSPPRFVSVKEALDEVAPASRFHLASLTCSVECIEPTDEALQKVVKFARETGDLHSLSDVDLKLLALTYMLEQQAYGSAHLRTRPPPVHVTQVRHVRERDLPGWGTNVQNLEEWEQLPQEPGETIDQGSHILGLKKLSLSMSEQENAEERNAPQEFNLHNFQEGNWHASEEEIGHTSQEEIAQDFQDVNGFEQEEELGNAGVILPLPGEAHGPFMQSTLGDERPVSLSKDADGLKEVESNVEVKVGQDGGDWQRSISRSTRRKHERRAARTAARGISNRKVDMESIEGTHGPTNVMSPRSLCKSEDSTCYDNDQCCSTLGNEGENPGEAVSDEPNNAEQHQDEAKSDEACPSLSESFHADEEQLVSIHETESEESWTLRPLSQSKIACVTADFPMQNVLLQMGLRVVSPNGLQIQKIHRWALKCEACRNVTSDIGRMFCPKCGNGGTLYKVSITIGPNGVVHTGTRKRFNIRGTKYSIPLPKGGRQGISENPILREDQLPQKILRLKKKVPISDLSSPAEVFAMKSGGKEKMQPPIREALAIFSGKRNPNHCRSKQRG